MDNNLEVVQDREEGARESEDDQKNLEASGKGTKIGLMTEDAHKSSDVAT